MDPYYLTLSGSEFQIYSSAEILQLSVKEISNPQTFDLLGNPLKGGLHDHSLGPTDLNDSCETCGLSESNCTGHFGHIKSPVLLFNPVLFKTLIVILKGTCMSCHKVMLPALSIDRCVLALRFLHKGLIAEAQDVLQLITTEDDTDVEAEFKIFSMKYESIKNHKDMTSKHSLTLMKATVASIIKNMSTTRKCVHCECWNREIKAENSRSIIGTLKTIKISKEAKVNNTETKNEKEKPVVVKTETDVEYLEMHESVNIKKEIETPSDDLISEIQTDIDQFTKSPHKRCILSPYVAQMHLRLVWENERVFLSTLFPFLAEISGLNVATDVFFLDVVPVAPTRFRPINMLNGRQYENDHTTKLASIIVECNKLKGLLKTYYSQRSTEESDQVLALTRENSPQVTQGILSSWLSTQTLVNSVLDKALDRYNPDAAGGVRQILEKKEGIFRMNMMGKRVNYSARSVISPDPYIAVNQIGIPLVFASKLTYPQPVTPWNIDVLRQMVLNGPDNYPGAFSVINEDGKKVRLSANDLTQREAIANQLLVPDKDVSGHKTVCRHLLNGDYLLLNRQPTLHRPSIQAHKARVLGGIKTLRLHYSNCKAYNADFDGDEMNVHFPQDEISRAEAATLACTDFQYLVPKDGSPLGGLIQDHMVAGVTLTTRGRFFNKHDYCSLLWGAMNDWQNKLELLPPAIIKPRPLWSGKQVISTIILNIIPQDQAPFNLNSKTKIPEKSWVSPAFANHPSFTPLNLKMWCSNELGESTVVFRQGELLQGVLDKAHYGPSPYGLVHCCYELYGGIIAGKLLTYLGRLFTTFLQMIGFSLGVRDILVLKKANRKRKSIIKKAQMVGREAVIKGLNLSKDKEITDTDVFEGLRQAHFGQDGLKMAEIDMCMKGETDQIQDAIAKSIMPWGLEKKFPQNALQLMVQSGAKGSPVNCMQISCLLGQIELEGRRPPLMMSGRSLPCFLPYDVSPQAGGFVTGRFLTGINPTEYFFHCMAGREGLIDTAVKTSRSGYLQRCLVKHLEGIMVNYDLTVRDSDGGIIQFYYGEDGVGPTQSSFLKASQFPFLTENLAALQGGNESPWLSPHYSKTVRRWWKKISKCRAHAKEAGSWIHRENGFLNFCNSQPSTLESEKQKKKVVKKGKCVGQTEYSKKLNELWFGLDGEKKSEMIQMNETPDPVMSKLLPHSEPDVMSEKFRHLVNVYCKKGLEKVKSNMPGYADVDQDMFKAAMNKKLIHSLSPPGEAVGLICAQSIGEPSTQMTLNTFHFAGRGEMNVTLGIPRLREILISGARMPKTPQVDVPLRPIPNAREEGEKLRASLSKVHFNQVLEYIKININSLEIVNNFNYKSVDIQFKCLRHSHYKNLCNLKYTDIISFVVKRFIPITLVAINRQNKILGKSSLTSAATKKNVPTIKLIVNESDKAEDDDDEQRKDNGSKEYEGEDEEKMEVEGDSEDDEGEDVMSDDQDRNDEMDDKSDEEVEGETQTEENKYIAEEDLDAQFQEFRRKALSHHYVTAIRFAEKKKRSFTVTFQFAPNEIQFDIRLMFEKLIKSSVIQEVQNINQAFLTEETENDETVLHLKTDGINIQYLFRYPEILDLNRIYTNSIHHMAQIYGIEAANRVIIKEVQNVFSAYGITVDYHHLSLLADYMTNRGGYDACSRLFIEKSQTSPFQKITFETSMKFLMDACLNGHKDYLQSPSAQLVLGKPVSIGTGCFDILGRH